MCSHTYIYIYMPGNLSLSFVGGGGVSVSIIDNAHTRSFPLQPSYMCAVCIASSAESVSEAAQYFL